MGIDMLFRHIDVLRADGTLLPEVFVGVRDKRIAYIGSEEPAGDWGEAVDGADYLMIPGLINSHTHVAMTLMRGYGDDMPLDRWLNDRIFPFEDKLTGEDVYWGSLLGIAEMLRSGTSIGANIAEAQYGSSRKDFLNKLYIALKECAETLYWLELLYSCDYISRTEYDSLHSDCEELRKLLSSITKSVRDGTIPNF